MQKAEGRMQKAETSNSAFCIQTHRRHDPLRGRQVIITNHGSRPITGIISQMNALPLILFFLAVITIGYRYYSAFLAAKVMALDDARVTPAHRFEDGSNYVPTNKWVLFGHHFAAISGAGPLIGPVLAAQFGYLPGLLWLAFGVVFAGAAHDFVILR